MNWKTTPLMALGVLALCGCDDGGGGPAAGDATDTPSATPCERPATANREPLACVTGRLVDVDGQPLEGLKVSACTSSSCIAGQTGPDGVYKIGGLPVEPHKLEILARIRGYATMIFAQPVAAGVYAEAPRDIVVPALEAAAAAWPPDAGGAVSVAGGMLELSAAAGTLKYPLGTVNKEVYGVEIAASDLPPFDIEPWVGKEAGTRAFILNPFPMRATASVGMRVLGADGVAAGTPYTVYTAGHLDAHLEQAGVATSDGAGSIVLEPGANLTTLTTIIVVPN